VEICPNFVLCATIHRPTANSTTRRRPLATITRHASISSSSAPFTSVSPCCPLTSKSSKPYCQRHADPLLPLANATRARRLNSRDSNITHKMCTPPTLPCGSVAGRLALFFACIRLRPTTDDGNRANEPCFVLVLLRFVCPCPSLAIPHLRRSSRLEFAGGRLTAPQPPQSLTLHASEALDCPALRGIGLCLPCFVFASARSRRIPTVASVMRSSRQQY